MARYNYQWSPKKQRRKTREQLFSYLRRVISKYSPFYREWFKKHNIDVRDIYTYKDFSEIPIISKKEHLKEPASFILQPNHPEWWDCHYETSKLSNFKTFKYWLKSLGKKYYREIFNNEPANEDERIIMEAINEWLPVQFLTTGNANEPQLIAYTKRDILKILPEISAHFYMTGFKANWEVYNIMSPAPSINFFQNIWSPITVGGGTFFTCDEEDTSLENQVNIASSITFEVFTGLPSETKKWLQYAKEALANKKGKKIDSFKLVVLTGETIKTDDVKEIKSAFNELGSSVKVIKSYTNNRAKASFYECSEGSGIHLNPRYFYWEVVDPKSMEPVNEGEKGLLCFSHIDWRGTAFIRYSTGDIVDGLVWKKCDRCGLTFPTVHKIKRK